MTRHRATHKSISVILTALLLTLCIAGCRYDNKIPDSIPMSYPAADFITEVEITDVYCTESGVPKNHMFELHFTLRNLTNEELVIHYYWTLNDPLADGPGYAWNTNDPIARVYQGQIKDTTLPSSANASPTVVVVNVKETRIYDPRFYRMYISVYRGDTQIGYYREQKSPIDWDYSILPPVRLETPDYQLPSPEPGTRITIPYGAPIMFEKLDYIMRGQFTYFYLYDTRSVLYIEETGLRMARKGFPPLRTWKTGSIPAYEFEQVLALFRSAEFENLEPNYQFPGKPIEGAPSGSFVSGDMCLTVSINCSGLNKTVKTNSYLTPDQGETYPDMPYPVDKIYGVLRKISLSTQKVAEETIP